MLASLLTRFVVRDPISTPIFRKTHEHFVNYSALSQILKNRIIKDSSSVIENNITTSLAKLLKSYDFKDPQIAKFFTKFPVKPSYNPTKVIKPMFDFLLDIGFSNTQLTKFICSNFFVLEANLENRIKPNILLLKPFYLTEKDLVRALMSSSSLLLSKLETNFFPNVRTLTNHGVPHVNILKLANLSPRILLYPKKLFNDKVQLVASMGFDPYSTLFVMGLEVILETSTVSWKKKASLYKSLGWSEEDIVSAFVRHPYCILASEKKIMQIMDFFVNQRQYEPSLVAKNPVLIKLSFEKRIVPRCLVIDILVKKQLVKKSTLSQYKISNKDFLEKYVTRYQHQAPEVLHAYSSSSNFAYLKNESQIS